jgi:hypothetical protein
VVVVTPLRSGPAPPKKKRKENSGNLRTEASVVSTTS